LEAPVIVDDVGSIEGSLGATVNWRASGHSGGLKYGCMIQVVFGAEQRGRIE
jgi:hypothetical protein